MVIQHNLPAMNSHRQMGVNNKTTSKNLEKLSSGFRINRAADDAAGLAISEKMRGQIRGTMMGTQNVNMGINLVNTAEGGLNETHAILQRMRELAVQSANGTYQDEDRAQIDKEFQALKSEIERVAESTHYNGIHLLNVPNDSGSVKFTRDIIEDSFRIVTDPGGTFDRIGDIDGAVDAMSVTDRADIGKIHDFARKLSDVVEISNVAFVDVITSVNNLIDELGEDAFDAGLLADYEYQRGFHYDNKSHYVDGYLGYIRDNITAALASSDPATAYIALSNAANRAGGGGIRACHKPVADAAWELLESVALPPNKNALWIQSGANTGDGMYISRCDSRPAALGVENAAVNPWEAANDAINLIEKATNIVSSYRADFGASQNRLESMARNNGVMVENLQAAESSIRDVDMAKEMMQFTKNNILVQASQSMLAQSNQLPQGVLSLLR